MLIPKLEPLTGPDSYPLSSALMAAATADLRSSGALDLNQPYGQGTTVLTAGMIGRLILEAGVTKLAIADVTNDAFVIFTSNFVDALKSGKCDFYYLLNGGKYQVKGCYDIGQAYTVGTKLTWIPSGANQGKLTPATLYGAQDIVARVIEPPASALNDDFMTIVTGVAI